jgi:hypothetical protein
MFSGLLVVASAIGTWLKLRQRGLDIGRGEDAVDVAVSLPDYPLARPGATGDVANGGRPEPGSYVLPRRPPTA